MTRRKLLNRVRIVMAGLVPAIHGSAPAGQKDVDARLGGRA
jgi:hypothetical protein